MRFGLRELIFLVVLLVVPVASYMYVFKPRNDQITEATAEVEQKQTRLAKLKEVEKRIDDIGLAIEETKEAIELINDRIPPEKQVDEIVANIWQLATQNGLTSKSVKAEKPQPATLYMELPYKVVMEGQFDGFYQFLLDLERLDRITRVHKMELSRTDSRAGPKGQSVDPGSMKAEFILSIYYQPQA